MARTRRITADYFSLTPQKREELRLAQLYPERVTAVLSERLSASRRELIERVIASRTQRLQIAVEGLVDPHNVAAILRTAEAFGVQVVHIISESRAFRSSTAVTQGTHKWLDVHLWDCVAAFVADMRAAERAVLIADMGGAALCEQSLKARDVVLVFGNESTGISEKLRGLADGAFRIEMYGFVESFNVSVAAAVAISRLRWGGVGDLSPAQTAVLRARYMMRAVRSGAEIAARLLREEGTIP